MPIDNQNKTANAIHNNTNNIQRFNTSSNKRKLSLNDQISNAHVYQIVQTEYISDSNRNSIYNLGKLTNPTNIIKENVQVECGLLNNNLAMKKSRNTNNLIFHSRNGSTVSSNNQNKPFIKENNFVESHDVDIIVNYTQKESQKSEKELKERVTTEGAQAIEPTYCIKCYIDTPIRAKHCKSCLRCIATFDHHCGWLGNCIGERNKWIFICFLFIHCIELFVFIPIVK